MPTLDSCLFFDGQCAEAMRAYERILGGRLDALLTYAESPDPAHCPPGDPRRIMHACLVLPDGRMLMASDVPEGMHKPMQGFALALNYPTAAEVRPVFDRLVEGGSVTMPVGPTFWAEAFGMGVDRFGTPWMVGGGALAKP